MSLLALQYLEAKIVSADTAFWHEEGTLKGQSRKTSNIISVKVFGCMSVKYLYSVPSVKVEDQTPHLTFWPKL